MLLSACRGCRPLVRSRRVGFFVRLPRRRVPSYPYSPREVDRILKVLLSGTVDCIPRGKGVVLSLSRAGARFLVHIGSGKPNVPSSTGASIFQHFCQTSSTEGGERRFNLKLYVTCRVVSLRGKAVSMLSAPNNNSAFRVSLPLTWRDGFLWRGGQGRRATSPRVHSNFLVFVPLVSS